MLRQLLTKAKRHFLRLEKCQGVVKVRSDLNMCIAQRACYATVSEDRKTVKTLNIEGNVYPCDEWTNMTPKILSLIGRNLHQEPNHPLCLIKDFIIQHFYKNYLKSTRTPLFAVFDSFSPVVTTHQNFDSMLIPENHVTRARSDNYYVNKGMMLRAHTSAHEHELLKAGLNAFIVVGDVYRRDTVDATHFPAFHQMECARLFNRQQLFAKSENAEELSIFEDGNLTEHKQACHTMEAAKLVEFELKQTLEKCMKDLFGEDVAFRWVDAYFPFTHPSFELEIWFEGEWMEMLGCGILQQPILNSAGASDSIGWAFGLGLERLAMKLFHIPDIRYFWTKEQAILSQFKGLTGIRDVKFQPVISKQPPVVNDLSFWIPDKFCSNDFYDYIRSIDDDLIESVALVDEFQHPKTGQTSHCYRIFYRHTSRTLSQSEVNKLHEFIKAGVSQKLNVVGRW